jgi:kynurenine formamidase
MPEVLPGGRPAQDLGALIDSLGSELSNWERWGPHDELGTVNLITPDARARAAASVRTGQVVSLALPLQPGYPQIPGGGRFNTQHVMTQTGTDALATGVASAYSDDAIAMSVHGHTHWDALSHVFHRGVMYNGRSAGLVSARGAAANDIVPLSRAMVARGVLLDLAPGGEVLAPSYEVTLDDLLTAAERQCVEIGAGDVLLLRTGHLGAIRTAGRWSEFSAIGDRNPSEPGIGAACLPWLHQRGVAAVASDNWAVEVLRGPATDRMPVHEVAIVHMGMPLGEMFDLDVLAMHCAADHRWDFMLSAPPLPIAGGVGGPVNPIAIR